MKLSELIYAFESDYDLECLKRGMQKIDLNPKYKALMVSRIVSDLQKRLGVIEAAISLTSVGTSAAYDISQSFMTPKVVTYGGIPLEKTSVEWIEKQYATTGQPYKYAIKYGSSTPQLYLYPTPNSSGDAIVLTSEYNYNLYSPSGSSTQDFGTFDGSAFTGNTILPTQYDQALILGMLKQIFRDLENDYDREINLLKVKQYTGLPFTYEFGNDTKEYRPLTYSQGVTVINEDFPSKEVRFTAVDGVITKSFNKGFSAITAVDDGTNITITSADSEFNPGTLVILNQSMRYTQTGENTITIEAGTGYGTLTIRILVWI